MRASPQKVGYDCFHEGAAVRKENLYLLIRIRWPGSVTVFTLPYGLRGTETQKQAHPRQLPTQQRAFCCFLFFVQPTSCALFCKLPSLEMQCN